MAVLKIRDENGNIQEITAIKGDKGEKGDKGDKGDPGLTPTIDQTFSPTSENAQSGKAVKEALTAKPGSLTENKTIVFNGKIPEEDELLYGAIFGFFHELTGKYGFISGTSNEVGGVCAAALGNLLKVLGHYSFGACYNNQVQGNFAAGFGNNTKALGNGTFTAGISTTAEQEGAVATGGGTYAQRDYSNAQNYGTQALGRFSDAAGYYTKAINNAESVVGKFNQPKDGENATLFQVGNGADDNNRHNAFEVYKDGRIGMGDVIFTVEEIKALKNLLKQ